MAGTFDALGDQGDRASVSPVADGLSDVVEHGRVPLPLMHGPDTCYYNIRPTDRNFEPVRLVLPDALQEELEALKRKAQDEDEYQPSRWQFEGQTLFMRDKGGSQFKWILENDFITLCIGRGKRTGLWGQVRLSSEYLWGCGDLGVSLSQVHALLRLVYGEYILLDQSGLDLAVDVLNLDGYLDAPQVKEHFISRAVLDVERPVVLDEGYIDGPTAIQRRWKRVAGLSFGLHTSAVSVVLYNKTDEVKYHSPEKKLWLYGLWKRAAREQYGLDWNEDMPVWRIEVRFSRQAFREFPNVSGAYEVLDHLRDLWTYAVGHVEGGEDGLPDGWIRFVDPAPDLNRSRWPVHPIWRVIQAAYDPPPVPESEYEREEREREELLLLVDAELAARPFAAPSSAKKRRKKRKGTPLPQPVQEAPEGNIRPFIRDCRRKVNLDRAKANLAGWAANIEAWRRGYAQDRASDEDEIVPDLSDTLHYAMTLIESYLEERMLDFEMLVQERRKRYRLVPVPAARVA